jgi:Cu(I)/Ag(I) efflux system periplasmic protein CusF
MKRLFTLLAATVLAGAAWAQVALTDAEVTKVDKSGGKLTLKHGEIKNLDMPPMTMSFRVSDPKWLETLAAGQKVRIAVEKVNGQYTVVQLER